MKHLFRFVTVVASMMLISVYIPEFMIYRFQTALIMGLIITLLGWAIDAFIPGDFSPFANAVIGALITAGILWLFSLTNLVSVNALGLAVTAIITGTVDLFLPSRARFTT